MKKIDILLIDEENPYVAIDVDKDTATVIRRLFIEQAKESMSLGYYDRAQDYIVAVNDLEKAINAIQEEE